jgi:hypothetical protein
VLITKGKTNWKYLLTVVILAGAVLAILLPVQINLLNNDLSAEISASMQGFVPRATGLDPNFAKQVSECFIPVAGIYGYTLRVVSGFRSISDQQAIYQSGRTVDGHIVSWAEPGRSLHNYGFAVDIVDRWRGYDIDFDKLAKIGKYCGLEQVDPPHFEHRAGLTTGQFEAGKRPPPLTLPCAVMDERAKTSQTLTLADLKNNNCGTPEF